MPVCDLLYSLGGETWVSNDFNLQRLQRNDRAMFRWIFGVKAKEGESSDDLLRALMTCSVMDMALLGKREQGGRSRSW